MKIAGVPEHFNYPWQLCIEAGEFEQDGIDLEWTDVPEGTGKLCQMLRSGETDLAVILTEGIVKDILAGNECKIVQVYVESPLIWGIHVDFDSPYKTLADLEHKKAAISRPGSGSQLMAYVNAANQNWDKNLDFEIVHTLDGAVEALKSGNADYFMWEHFMTKPLVDDKTFRLIADCPTPWPSFVIVARNEILEKSPESVSRILEVINRTTIEFKEIPSIERDLANQFSQNPDDLLQWLELTQWSQRNVSEAMLNKIQNQLLTLGIIEKKGTFEEIVHRK